ncbi:MAG: uS17 family ribosomal protein [Patescibacteria group bacterium]
MSDISQSKHTNAIRGEIISHKTANLAVVKVVRVKVHPKYHKRYTVKKTCAAHDAKNEFKVGDKVEIIPCRPISKTKRFKIIGKV